MQVTRMEIDVAKPVFEVHGVARHGQVLVRKPLTRANIQAVCAPLPPCRIGMDTCASAHDSARE
jgi:transposase